MIGLLPCCCATGKFNQLAIQGGHSVFRWITQTTNSDPNKYYHRINISETFDEGEGVASQHVAYSAWGRNPIRQVTYSGAIGNSSDVAAIVAGWADRFSASEYEEESGANSFTERYYATADKDGNPIVPRYLYYSITFSGANEVPGPHVLDVDMISRIFLAYDFASLPNRHSILLRAPLKQPYMFVKTVASFSPTDLRNAALASQHDLTDVVFFTGDGLLSHSLLNCTSPPIDQIDVWRVAQQSRHWPLYNNRGSFNYYGCYDGVFSENYVDWVHIEKTYVQSPGFSTPYSIADCYLDRALVESACIHANPGNVIPPFIPGTKLIPWKGSTITC